MSISSLSTLATTIKNKWQTNIVQSRQGEEDQLKAHLGSSTTYATVTQQFDDWIKLLSSLASKPRVSSNVSKTLQQAATQCLSELSVTLDHAGNGVEWLCANRGFNMNFTLATVLIREITSEYGREGAAIVDAARDRIENDMSFLQQGSAYAQNLVDNKKTIEAQIETISDANDSVEEKLEELKKSTSNAQTNIEKLSADLVQLATTRNEEIEESVTTFSAALKEAKGALAEAAELKAQAETLVKTAITANELATKKFSAAETDLAGAIKKQQMTNDRLTEALKSAQMEGLAGSFTKKATEAESAIKKEYDRFETALKYLVIVGGISLLIEVFLGFPKTTDDFIFRLIRTLSLAAPGIWIAWSSTRKLAALNRIFSDYQYKSASALAYESYRQTVAEAGDDELKKQLLAFAIRSFGENPTRYYDSAQNDPSSPADSWLNKLNPWSKNGSDKPATPT